MVNKFKLLPNSWAIRCSFHTLVALIVAILVIGAVYLTAESENLLEENQVNGRSRGSLSRCDLFSGKWVFDNKSYPLYKEKECKFMSDQLACEKYGRKDLSYRNWRWQPKQCDLPRFNATALLEKLRDKRLVYVGDSLNRNQWVSMVCLVETTIPQDQKSMNTNGSLITFKASDPRSLIKVVYIPKNNLFKVFTYQDSLGDSIKNSRKNSINKRMGVLLNIVLKQTKEGILQAILKEYNATIEFYWAPLLVESNSDDPVKHRLPERIVRAQSIEKHARFWTNADILVFNTYLWWRRPKMQVLWGSFESPDGVYKEVEMLRSYEMALKTWADWLEIHLNRNKTELFFISMSPTHERAEEWGKATDQNCYNETEPIIEEGHIGSGSDSKMMHIVEETITGLAKRGLRVEMLNVTQLSEYRKEGHPSVFRKQWEPLTEDQILKPATYADCIHWCLPGVPDVWNQILYAYIFRYDNKLITRQLEQ